MHTLRENQNKDHPIRKGYTGLQCIRRKEKSRETYGTKRSYRGAKRKGGSNE